MRSPPLSIESLAQVVRQVQTPAREATGTSGGSQCIIHAPRERNCFVQQANKHKPEKYDDNVFVTRSAIHMDIFLHDVLDNDDLPLAVTYLAEAILEWWNIGKESDDRRQIKSLHDPKRALNALFNTLNKERIEQEKLACRRQAKDVPTFNDNF